MVDDGYLGNGYALVGAPEVAPELARGMADTVSAAPDPILGFNEVTASPSSNADFLFGTDSEDLFQEALRGGGSNVFGPFTNPSSDLHVRDGADDPTRQQSLLSGITVYDVQWANAGRDSMFVSVRIDSVRRYPNEEVADTLRADMTWDGRVQLTGDVVIREGTAVGVIAGSEVVARAAHDENATGRESGLTEFRIDGQFVVSGTADSTVAFSSSRDNSIENFLGAGEVADPAPGDWFGLRYHVSGCERPSYGYMGSFQPLSVIEHGDVSYSKVGVAIEEFAAPSLLSTSFENIANDCHVLLDSCDVFLPAGYFVGGSCAGTFDTTEPGPWSLVDGTNVVATNSAANDAGWVGTAGKVDLVADATLIAEASTDSIRFRPRVENDATSNDWGGLFLGASSDRSCLDLVSIGHAANPLFAFYPDSTSLKNSTVHHFSETGVWVYGTAGDGFVSSGNVIERGNGINGGAGDLGIYLDSADHVSVEDTKVDLTGLNSSGGGTGIFAAWGKTFCTTDPPALRTLSISNSLVLGPGSPGLGSDYVGIESYWLCGLDGERDVELLENGVYDWKNVGMEFYQCADTQIGCNHILECNRGVDIYRDSDPTGVSLRFKDNRIEALEPDPGFFALRTNDSEKVKLGPSNATRGDNRLAVNLASTKFVYENDSDSTFTLNATYNYWYADSLLTNSTAIQNRVAPAGASVNVSSFHTTDVSSQSCYSSVPDGGSAQPWPGPQVDQASDRAAANAEAPVVLSLSKPYPNPLRDGVRLDLAVPESRAGLYVLEVYDVAGRRILESKRTIATAGRYELSWAGRGKSGSPAVNGVYFLRLQGPGGFRETRKVTLLR